MFYTNPGNQLGYGVPNFHYALQLLNIDEVLPVLDGNSWIKPTPNPFKDELVLQVYRDTNETLALSVVDIAGKVVLEKDIQLNAGLQQLKINASNLSRGIYFVKAIAGETRATIKVLKH